MTFYNDLLKKAVLSIEVAFRKRSLGNLLAMRDGTLLPQSKQVTEKTGFELITWLAIR